MIGRSRGQAVPRRTMLKGAACATGALLLAGRAEATLFRGLSLPALAQASDLVLVVTPLDASSHFQLLGGRRRIVTDTRVRVEDVIARGVPTDGEFWVRTLGGTVGDRAALVYGEAALFRDETSVLFMVRDADVHRVTGMAQGHYPVFKDPGGTPRLLASRNMPRLIGDAKSAVAVLTGKPFSAARALILGARH